MTIPMGRFFVLMMSQAQQFANHYFEGLDVASLKISGKLSPKILVKALINDYQYHYRRAEIWH
jgi:hypothetical protein